jgi:hypothetical protein
VAGRCRSPVRGRSPTVAVLVLALAASCGVKSPNANDSAQVMAASLYQLVTVDNTFGGSSPPFTTYLIQASTDPYAGTGTETATTPRALTQDERGAIEAIIEPLGTVQWIDDPAEYRTSDLMPTIEGAAILGVGEPVFDSKGALVPVSLWCSGLCGTWFTYRLQQASEGWEVTGIEGPRAIS